MFNSADAGTINVIGALAALKAVDNSTISSSSAGGVMASPQNAFGLDQSCLARCGLGASGGGFSGLSSEMSVSPAQAPSINQMPAVCSRPVILQSGSLRTRYLSWPVWCYPVWILEFGSFYFKPQRCLFAFTENMCRGLA